MGNSVEALNSLENTTKNVEFALNYFCCNLLFEELRAGKTRNDRLEPNIIFLLWKR